MISEGTHKAEVAGCYIGESSEKKTPFFAIEFKLENGSYIDNTFYLTNTEFEKQGKKTTPTKEGLRTLTQLGYKGKSLTDMAKEELGIDDLFVKVDDISIVVYHEEYEKDGETKYAAKVKFVNVGKRNVNKLDHKQSVVKFKGYNFDGLLMGLRKDIKVNVKVESEAQGESFASDDIPF